jgi:hypothetical protein
VKQFAEQANPPARTCSTVESSTSVVDFHAYPLPEVITSSDQQVAPLPKALKELPSPFPIPVNFVVVVLVVVALVVVVLVVVVLVVLVVLVFDFSLAPEWLRSGN